MTALWTLLAGLLLAGGAWRWSASGIDGASRVALVAVLGVIAATFNVIVPVPSIEATTTVVLCAALVLGARTAIATGLVAVIGSSVAGGIGTWTIWQVVAVAVIAVIGAVTGRALDANGDWYAARRITLLGLVAVVSTLAWDVIVTVGGIASYATQPGSTAMQQVIAALLFGAAFTVVHVVFSTAFTVVGGPPLLHTLSRAKPRLDGGRIDAGSRHQLA
jgi:energy-coupling factor transport system substrate-specific component